MGYTMAYLKNCRAIVPAEEPLPDTMTLKVPKTPFDVWNAELGDWELDKAKWLDELVRPERNKRLDAADQRVRRYDYQFRVGFITTESANQIAVVLAYMQALRDLPGTAEYAGFSWPEVP